MEHKIQGPRIVMIGAGHVAFHFANALHSKGYHIVQVYSRTIESAKALADLVQAEAITSIGAIDLTTDVFIFALNDNVLEETIHRINFSGQLALHTSGTLSIDIFKGKAEFYGVLYPLQTLSKFRKVNMQEIPLLIEANSSKELSNLKLLAQAISARVMITDSLQRRKIHLAAIFASNFANHMYVIADELMKKSGFSYELLKPLILETALKAVECGNPMAAQTGPAVRLNKSVVEKHREMLASNSDLQNIYTSISNHIALMHHNSPII